MYPMGNTDQRLTPMTKILADLRRDFLKHEPGTADQAQAYKRYEEALRLQATGVFYVPKF
jgi:hypothetical protein